jgi:hypothetical protein
MNRRSILVGLGLLPYAARAETMICDAWCDQLLGERSRFGHAIHLFGDSLFRGYALGVLGDELGSAHPLYAFRSPAAMMNLVLADNGRPEVVNNAGPAINDDYDAPSMVRRRIADGVIRPGDVVVFEDAGPHGSDPVAYQGKMAALRQAVCERHDITCVMMTMFDYPPAPLDAQYDAPFNGRTMNDAVRAAATAETSYVGRTLLLDLNAAMDEWRSEAARVDNLAVIHPDGIHPNVWGQAFMAGEILKIAGWRPYLTGAPTAVWLAHTLWRQLAYGTRFSREKARSYALRSLLR